MRHLAPLIAAFAALCASHLSLAATSPSDPCVLLDWHDLQSMGVTQDTQITSAGWRLEKTPEGLAGNRLFTNLCAATVKSEKGRAALTLTIDSVKGSITERQFGDWLKSVAATDTRENEKDVHEIKVGDTNCESGRDELTIPSDYEDQERTVIEYYVACDAQVGFNHVSMNAQVAEGKKNELPSPELIKTLLDKSTARMKQTVFKAPD